MAGSSFDDMVRAGKVQEQLDPEVTARREARSDAVGRSRHASSAAASPSEQGEAAGESARMQVVIYTDGSSRGNPGPGGYGAVLLYVDPSGCEHLKELSQGYRMTTNNRMELMGVIAALEALKRPCEVELHSDSQYVVNAFNKGWVWGWARKGWKTASKQPVKNPDLWKRLLGLYRKHAISFIWVKGHADSELNNRCDKLATDAADGLAGPLKEDKGFFYPED